MDRKKLLFLSLGTFLILSATAVSAQTVSWQFGSDHMSHTENLDHTNDISHSNDSDHMDVIDHTNDISHTEDTHHTNDTSHTNVVVDNSSSTPTVTYYHPPKVDQSEQLKLRSLFQEHAALTADTLIARFDNAPQFDAAQEALTNNSNLIEQEIGNMYGSDVQNQFTRLWQNHNDQYIRYTDGLKGNTTLKDDAKAQLDTIIEQLASLFDSKTGSSHADLVDLFKNHVYFTRQIIEMHAAQNYRMQFEYAHAGFEHAAAMSDALVTSTQ